MVFGLIVIIFFVVLLVFFIGKNISNICTIWFFKTFTDVPVSILVFVAFASGIVLAIICLLIGKLKSSSKPMPVEKPKKDKAEKINKKKSLLKKAEKAAKSSENNSDATIVADSMKLDKK